jgi:hypothetical protein
VTYGGERRFVMLSTIREHGTTVLLAAWLDVHVWLQGSSIPEQPVKTLPAANQRFRVAGQQRCYSDHVPLPLAVGTLLSRAEGSFYRSIAQMKVDVRLLHQNAALFWPPRSKHVAAVRALTEFLLAKIESDDMLNIRTFFDAAARDVALTSVGRECGVATGARAAPIPRAPATGRRQRPTPRASAALSGSSNFDVVSNDDDEGSEDLAHESDRATEQPRQTRRGATRPSVASLSPPRTRRAAARAAEPSGQGWSGEEQEWLDSAGSSSSERGEGGRAPRSRRRRVKRMRVPGNDDGGMGEELNGHATRQHRLRVRRRVADPPLA